MKVSPLIVLIFFLSCTGKKDGQRTSAKEEVKFEQYLVEGQTLYITHCANCHQAEGQGLARLYPPLAKSDYLMQDIGRAVCTIQHGLVGEIMVNNISYNQPMPAIPTLTKLEIAELLTYVTNSWGNENGLVSIKQVEKAQERCNTN